MVGPSITINKVTTSNAPLPVSTAAADWHPFLVADETANDSDKTLTVPASYEYQILSIWVELATTATVGTRQLEVQIQDAGPDVIGEIIPGVTQAASLSYNYLFSAPCADLTAVRDSDFVMTPLPFWVLPAGYSVRIYDNNAVDAAADDMIVQMLVARRAV